MVTNEPNVESPRLVGAVDGPLVLAGPEVEAWLPLRISAARLLAVALAEATGPRRGVALLRFEGITGPRTANLAVSLAPADGAASASQPGRRAGVLGLFGLAQASKPGPQAGEGQGMAISLDITELLAELWPTPAAIPARLRIHVSPTRRLPLPPEIRIGKISLLHALAAGG